MSLVLLPGVDQIESGMKEKGDTSTMTGYMNNVQSYGSRVPGGRAAEVEFGREHPTSYNRPDFL
ncbi:MAG: hypothetical protein LUQ50_00185 [Methanospirillum sp.]|uniref:hypothetical protein n=1 Tax=Methanospirillum sp. TaxID=45200 RepID=UPI002371CD08|nr:hypothetical protein [Methanospirillum sp.]MDD1727468.1 hypothetical protein [Methanospirillum sp.]